MHRYKTLTAFVLALLVSTTALAATVNINTAGVETLSENLSNVGPEKAQAIVEYREQNGPFESADELLEVRGIGPATLSDNRANIEVGSSGAE